VNREEAEKIADKILEGIERDYRPLLKDITDALVEASQPKFPSDAVSFDACKQAWMDYPSQDNEGYLPDRGGFKCGWKACYNWMIKQMQKGGKRE
jgi:hypothetical protein